MPTLDWMGKEKVITHHRDVPFRVLERMPNKCVLDSHGSDCGNMIIHGDNLAALKALLLEYEGRVDCVYIDSTGMVTSPRCPTHQPLAAEGDRTMQTLRKRVDVNATVIHGEA